MPDKLVRVLVVDDSLTARAVLMRLLQEDDRIEVVGRAVDGLDALEQVKQLRPDVVTLDIEMPRLDGIATLERLMAETPTPVVMVSSLTRKGADATMRALEIGAVDFVEKPTRNGVIVGASVGALGLAEKVVAAAGARVRRWRPTSQPHPATQPAERSAPAVSATAASMGAGAASPRALRFAGAPAPARSVGPGSWLRRTVVIGSSTGGPQALHQLLVSLPGDLGVPIVVVQHMPPGFTRSLAERLDSLSALHVSEARPGDRLENGHVLLAPGGHHLLFDAQGVVHLGDGPAECGVRPAINVTMESVVRARGFSIIGVVLTGIGTDGTRGAQLIHDAGGTVLAQDEESSVVYGMPRSVAQAGLADEVHPLDQMAEAVVRWCSPGAAVKVRRAG